ncbi:MULTISPECIES: hypothetical protein [unclassified Kitasatospora]|uniref:hypothetical protein n=1 Tax=unclassified Kitasatospora TaxID=2633591 RepID=UPI0033C9C690
MYLPALFRAAGTATVATVFGAALLLPLIAVNLPALLVMSFSATGHRRTVQLAQLIADWTRASVQPQQARPRRSRPQRPARPQQLPARRTRSHD